MENMVVSLKGKTNHSPHWSQSLITRPSVGGGSAAASSPGNQPASASTALPRESVGKTAEALLQAWLKMPNGVLQMADGPAAPG